ncbi:MAG: response regulator [Nitrospirota bacterium]
MPQQTKVLLVDDEIEFVTALAERLQLRNYDVRYATNALEAISSINTYGPDVIILDLKIPGMDGIEILKTIKKLHQTIEVIMLTGHGDTKSVEEGMKSGAFEYIMKPIDIAELTSKIDKAKKRRNQMKDLSE